MIPKPLPAAAGSPLPEITFPSPPGPADADVGRGLEAETDLDARKDVRPRLGSGDVCPDQVPEDLDAARVANLDAGAFPGGEHDPPVARNHVARPRQMAADGHGRAPIERDPDVVRHRCRAIRRQADEVVLDRDVGRILQGNSGPVGSADHVAAVVLVIGPDGDVRASKHWKP